MAKYVPVEIAGGAYQDATRPFDQQDTVNYIPEVAQNAGARSRAILKGLPGLIILDGTILPPPPPPPASKFYFEVRMDSLRNGSPLVGIADIAIDTTAASSVSIGALGWSLQWDAGSTGPYSNWVALNANSASTSGNGSGTIAPKSSPFVVGCAVDLANGKIWWSVDGEWLGGGNPETGANPNWDDDFVVLGQNTISGRTVKACVGVIASDGIATAKFIKGDLTYATPNGFTNINQSTDGMTLTFAPTPVSTRVVLSNGNMTVSGNGILDGIRVSTWSRS